MLRVDLVDTLGTVHQDVVCVRPQVHWWPACEVICGTVISPEFRLVGWSEGETFRQVGWSQAVQRRVLPYPLLQLAVALLQLAEQTELLAAGGPKQAGTKDGRQHDL